MRVYLFSCNVELSTMLSNWALLNVWFTSASHGSDTVLTETEFIKVSNTSPKSLNTVLSYERGKLFEFFRNLFAFVNQTVHFELR